VALVSDKQEMSNQAQKWASRGLIDKAISEWQKLISGTPKDGDIHNTIGDLHLRVNRGKEAISAYLKAADVFRCSGFDLKCAALLKKVIKIDPSRMEVYEKLADIHADRGLSGNAASDYLKAAHYYAQRNEHDAALSVYQKLSRLDSNSAEVHVNIAETYKKLGLSEKAVEACEAALALQENSALTEALRQRIEQILEVAPNAPKAPIVLPPRPPPEKAVFSENGRDLPDRMQAALRADDWERAQTIIEGLTPDVQLHFLSEWFDASLQKNAPRAFMVLHKFLFIAEQHPARLSEASDLLQRYVQDHPDQLSAQELLAETLEKLGNVQEAGPVYSKVLSLLLASGGGSDAHTYYEMMKVKYSDQALAWKERFEPSAPRLVLAEGTVAVFVPASEPEPDSGDFLEASPVPERGDAEASMQGTAPVTDLVEVGDPILLDATDEIAPAEIAPVQELSEVLFDSYLTEADVYAKYKLHSKAAERLRYLAKLAPTRVEPHLRLKEIYLQEGMTEQAVEACLILVQLYEAQGADDPKRAMLEALGEIDPNGAYHTRPMPAQDGGGRPTPDVCEGQAGSEASVDDVVQSEANAEVPEAAPSVAPADVEAFLEKSLPDWMSIRFSEVISGHFCDPSRNGIDRGASDLIDTGLPDTMREAPEAGHENGAVSHEADAYHASGAPHLAEIKEDAIGPLPGDESKCFGEAEPIPLDDLEAHYQMGSTYREMGLIHEAMDEMAFVLRGDALFRDATCLLAYCYQDRDMNAEAIELLQRAIEDTRCREEDALAFKNQIALFQGITGTGVTDARIPDADRTETDTVELSRESSERESSEAPSLGLVSVREDVEEGSLQGNQTDPSLSAVGVKRKKKKISYL
jgi:tetratricopeptide (TPR) repeat protein